MDDALSGDFGGDFFILDLFELEVVESGGSIFPGNGEGLVLAC